MFQRFTSRVAAMGLTLQDVFRRYDVDKKGELTPAQVTDAAIVHEEFHLRPNVINSNEAVPSGILISSARSRRCSEMSCLMPALSTFSTSRR